MLDSLYPSVSLSLLPFLPTFPPSLRFYFPSFLLPSPLLSTFLLVSLLVSFLAFLPSFKHMYYSFFSMSSPPRDLPAWLSIAPCLPLMLSLWNDCCTWTGTRITFEADEAMKKRARELGAFTVPSVYGKKALAASGSMDQLKSSPCTLHRPEFPPMTPLCQAMSQPALTLPHCRNLEII